MIYPSNPIQKFGRKCAAKRHVCTQKTCGQDPRCFYQQARKRLLAADVIVLNHTLLFILLGSPDMQEERESGFLFPNDFIVFDEAHTVEQIASKQIGIGVSQYGLRSTIQRLYNARTRKGLFTVMRDAVACDSRRNSSMTLTNFFPQSSRNRISQRPRVSGARLSNLFPTRLPRG